MSYCRLGYDSDVYVYESKRGLECCGCKMLGDYHTRSYDEMISHLEKHIEAGHAVPSHVIPWLKEESEE